VASGHVFDDYRSRKEANTLKRREGDLALFAEFLQQAGATVGDLATDPAAWRGITWGLVAAFVKWQLGRGYSIGSINVRLSTVKTFAGLAVMAETLDRSEYAMIRLVKGFKHGEAKKIDEKRSRAGQPTRTGRKKAEAVSLTKEQPAALKAQPDTPQGRRDALLMA
jgi:hypothetical protein